MAASMLDASSSSSSHQHAIYRRKVCQYLSSINNPILKEMERTLGRHALQNDHAVVPVVTSTLPQQVMDKEIRFDMRVPPSLVHCHNCGVCLKGRIRIHAVNRGSTRRRRASRRVALRKREQQRYSKCPTVGRLGDDTERAKELARLFQVTDGTCKNVIAQTCDHCGTQRKMKGMAVTKRAAKSSVVKPKAEAAKLENDTHSDAVKKPDTTGAFQSPLLVGKTKKKKKKPEPKSGLMNFLSSLNN
ncbi:hypothetical protein MHU86_22168 [Fragilaria crotonensis]|nr:hypothetical protein MHU86_22168 [Fragilaria crotonensis]